MSRMSLGIGASLAVIYPILYLIGADSGVVFCRKADFDSVGGYGEGLSFAEDIDFFLRFKRASGARAGVPSIPRVDPHRDRAVLIHPAAVHPGRIEAEVDVPMSVHGHHSTRARHLGP